LSDITDELHNEKGNEELGNAAIRAVAESENENGNETTMEDEIAQDVLIDIDPAMIGALHSDEAEEAGEDDKRIPQPTEETFEEEDARDVKIGRWTIPNVKSARPEKDGLKNIVTIGRLKMEKKNLRQSRFRANAREKREHDASKDTLFSAMQVNKNNVGLTPDAFGMLELEECLQE
jgi:hypothetical protein